MLYSACLLCLSLSKVECLIKRLINSSAIEPHKQRSQEISANTHVWFRIVIVLNSALWISVVLFH